MSSSEDEVIILVAHRAGKIRWSYNAGAIKQLKDRLEGRNVWELVDDPTESVRLKEAFAVVSSLGEQREIRLAIPEMPWFPDDTTIVMERVDEVVVVTFHRSCVRFKSTKRERDVLKLICEGLSGQEIANALGISHATVETHRTRLYEKSGCSGTASLVRWAIRNDLAQP